jgi:hypothetical protein
MAKSPRKTKAAPKTQVTARGDQAPDAKATTKAQQDAAEALFTGADGAVRTEEQHENHVRRQALGY